MEIPKYSTINLLVEDRVARLTLNRPDQLNALDPQMLAELLDALGRLRAEGSLNILILTGSGRLFSAGVDLTTPFFMEDVKDTSIYSGTRLLNEQHRVIEAIYNLPFISVAALNGHAVGGGGFGLAMACDLRVAVKSARFWMVPMSLDVVQDFGLTWLLQRQIGPSRTLQMAILGSQISAEQGLEWGMINEVVEDGVELTNRVQILSSELAHLGSDALRMLKLLVRTGARNQLVDQLDLEAVANGLAFQSEEFKSKKAAYFLKLASNRK